MLLSISLLTPKKNKKRLNAIMVAVISFFKSCHIMTLSDFVIDSMHNLLLTYILTVWKALGIIDKHHLSSIQDIVDGFVSPEIGCIPSKIASGFTSFTAEQWKIGY